MWQASEIVNSHLFVNITPLIVSIVLPSESKRERGKVALKWTSSRGVMRRQVLVRSCSGRKAAFRERKQPSESFGAYIESACELICYFKG